MKRFLFFITLCPAFCLQVRAQSLKEILERPWWGQGRFETEMVMHGRLIISYQLIDLSVDSDNVVRGKLSEKIILEETPYFKTTLITGKAAAENNFVEMLEFKVLSADTLPDPFEWPATALSLKAGYDPDRPSGFALKGQARWGTLKGEVEFRDYPYTH